MDKVKAVKNINKIGKAGTAISTVIQVFLIIGIVGVIVGAAFLLTIPSDLFSFSINSGGNMEFDVDGIAEAGFKLFSKDPEGSFVDVDFTMNGIDYEAVNTEVNGSHVSMELEGTSNVITPARLGIVLAAAGVILLMTMAVMIFIKKLCKSIRDCESPFDQTVIKNLEHCAWALIPWIFVSGISQNFIKAGLTGGRNMMFSVNLSTVLVILLIFALTYIFKYGAQLQTESDETL